MLFMMKLPHIFKKYAFPFEKTLKVTIQNGLSILTAKFRDNFEESICSIELKEHLNYPIAVIKNLVEIR